MEENEEAVMTNRGYNIIMTILVTISLSISGWVLLELIDVGKSDVEQTVKLDAVWAGVSSLRSDVQHIENWKEATTNNRFTISQAETMKEDLRMEFIQRVDSKFELIIKDIEYIKKQLDSPRAQD